MDLGLSGCGDESRLVKSDANGLSRELGPLDLERCFSELVLFGVLGRVFPVDVVRVFEVPLLGGGGAASGGAADLITRIDCVRGSR